MPKRLILVLIAVIVLISGGLFLLKNDGNGESANSQTPTPSPESTVTSTTAGQYVDYSPDIIVKTTGTKVLFFHAPWCPQCRALEKSIKSGQIPEGVTIIKTDYDSNQALRQKYSVTIQTTLVKVDDQGNLIEKYVAYDEPTLQAIIDNLL